MRGAGGPGEVLTPTSAPLDMRILGKLFPSERQFPHLCTKKNTPDPLSSLGRGTCQALDR